MTVFRKYKDYVIILLLICWFSLTVSLDLENGAQEFVLETKQIKIPEYPHAFNPSIIRFNNKLLLSFRIIPDPKQSFNSWLGLIWLDDNFNPQGKVQPIIMQSSDRKSCRAEEGRLIAVDSRLYLVYSDNEEKVISKGGFRMYVAELHYDNHTFYVKKNERLSYFEGNDRGRREKNWVPFSYHNRLMLAYSIVPHRIFIPLLDDSQSCKTIACSQQLVPWQWGDIRGGTTGILNGDHYLAFFHSSKRMKSVHSDNRESMHYFMGAYTFSAKPPFEITHVSSEPIIGKNFYHGAQYKPYWGSVNVVFPCGFLFDEPYVWIAYGRQDHELWVAKIDKQKLYASLISVS